MEITKNRMDATENTIMKTAGNKEENHPVSKAIREKITDMEKEAIIRGTAVSEVGNPTPTQKEDSNIRKCL